ncbi:MAG: hypothetical protein ACU83O_01355 [Gammaproteobacteria bacterium]
MSAFIFSLVFLIFIDVAMRGRIAPLQRNNLAARQGKKSENR